MQGFTLARRGLLILLTAVFAAGLAGQRDAEGDGGSCLKPARPVKGAVTLARHGEISLERLPWDATVIRINLGKDRPVAVAACYLMKQHLLVLAQNGMVYCLDRNNLRARWVASLRYPIKSPPCEGPTDYVFLTKGNGGATYLETINRRAGTRGERFPKKLAFASSGGVAANGSMAFVPSLGSPRNNKTFETVSLVTGRRGWGYLSSGLIFGAPAVSPSGDIVVFGSQDGVVTSLPASASAPSSENWTRSLAGHLSASPTVTPEQVVIGTQDGLLYCLNLLTGKVNWLQGVDDPIKESAWVFGGMKTSKRSTGIEGAADIDVSRYEGIAFARNRSGTHAFDLSTGKPLFSDAAGPKPLCRNGKYIATLDRRGMLTLRDASSEFEVKGRLNLSMFHLMPTNRTSGAIYACTADGTVVAAIPK